MTTPQQEYTAEELKAIRKEYAPKATDEQFNIWISDCQRRGLVPVRDVLLLITKGRVWDEDAQTEVYKSRPLFITTIGGLRKIAQRTGKYAGQQPTKWIYLDEKTEPTIERTVPTSGPFAAKVGVLRSDFQEPLIAVARFEAYAQYTKTKSGGKQLNHVWNLRGPEQLEKCAEALALRKAFPEELSGLYIVEEINSGEAAEPEILETTKEKPIKAVEEKKEEKISPIQESVATSIATAEKSELVQTSAIEFPTKEERQEFVNKIRFYTRTVLPKAGVEKPAHLVQEYIQKTYSVEPKNLTKSQWLEVVAMFDNNKDNVENLVSTLKG